MKEFILPYWRKLTLILILGTVATLSGLAQPYFTKLLIDDALLGRNASLLLWISIAMLGVTALSFALMPRARKCLEADTEAVRQRSSDLGSFLIETLMGMRTIMLMTKEHYEIGRFQERNDHFVRALLRRQMTSIVVSMIPSAGLTVGTLLVFVIGGYEVIRATMTLGVFVAFMAYQGRLIAPIQNVMSLYANLATLKVSVKRVMELLQAKPDVIGGTEPMDSGCGTIEFQNVDFRHDRDEVLMVASFTIPAGSFCVILGPSGAGKSSIANLLIRLYDPDSGNVLLDGQDIRRYRLADLRRALALVEQDTFLFGATIEQNIRYGGDHVDPAGFPAFLPIRGRRSRFGTLRRRKAAHGIARALARDPDLLILDEATSAMDIGLERKVLSDLRLSMKKRTMILITHRTYLANGADLVLQVEGGKVVAREPCSKLQ